MKNVRNYQMVFMVLCMVLLSGTILVGCRGGLGWDRMDGPQGKAMQSNVHQLP